MLIPTTAQEAISLLGDNSSLCFIHMATGRRLELVKHALVGYRFYPVNKVNGGYMAVNKIDSTSLTTEDIMTQAGMLLYSEYKVEAYSTALDGPGRQVFFMQNNEVMHAITYPLDGGHMKDDIEGWICKGMDPWNGTV